MLQPMLLRASRVVVWRFAMSFGAEVGTAVTRAAAAREATTKNFIFKYLMMSRKERGKRGSRLEHGKNDGIVNPSECSQGLAAGGRLAQRLCHGRSREVYSRV